MYETVSAGILNANVDDWITGYVDLSLIDWQKVLNPVVKA